MEIENTNQVEIKYKNYTRKLQEIKSDEIKKKTMIVEKQNNILKKTTGK